MQLKSITAIVVLLLVVASLLVSGCTISTTNQTPTPSTATHDAFLEKYLPAYKDEWNAEPGQNIQAWNQEWINSTSARVEFTSFDTSQNVTLNRVVTLIVFPTTQDATNYLNAMNKTEYSLISTHPQSGHAYDQVSGHVPNVYKEYEWKEGSQYIASGYKHHTIDQMDNLIRIFTGKVLD